MSGIDTDTIPLDRAFAACEAIAARANANFFHAARLLPEHRRRFFLATYAAMRIIDDLVDAGFLPLDDAARAAARPAMLRTIDDWQAQALGMPRDGPMAPDVLRAFAATACSSDLGEAPWRDLATAMRHDASEAGLSSRDDFLAYCRGATVAPATVFVYLLGCRHEPGQGYRHGLPEPAAHYAADLAVYCYLVHIMRDLAKDAGESERLLTIPADMLAEAGLARSEIAALVARRDPRLAGLGRLLSDMAEPYRVRGHARLATLLPLLGIRERAAIVGLIGIYDALLARFRAGYLDVVADAPSLETGLRARAFPGAAG